MRRLLVGVFFLVGFPNLFGFFFGGCVRVALLCANPFGSAKVRSAVSEIVGGVATAFAVVLIANLLGLRSTAWLVAVAIWFTIYLTRLNRMGELIRTCAGVICGWCAYAAFLNGVVA